MDTTGFVDICNAVDQLRRALDGCGPMAGGDPVGRAWARRYDPAAASAVRAAADLVTEEPVAATSAGCRPPSAHGGRGTPPVAWTLVARLADLAWPSGRAATLRTAADAWRRSATALQDAADVSSGSPAGRARWQTLARAHRTLGLACRGFADDLDRAHAGIAATLTAHGLDARPACSGAAPRQLSAISYAAGGAPVEVATGWRIAAAAGAVRPLLAAFAVAAGERARPLPLVGELCADVSRLTAPGRVGRHAARAPALTTQRLDERRRRRVGTME